MKSKFIGIHSKWVFRYIYILDVFTEKPYSKPLERNVVYNPIITLSKARNVYMNPSFTLHATQCSLHFDKSQKNEIHSLTGYM